MTGYANRFEQVSGLYARITRALIDRGLTITTMESCTGGLIASLITDTEGSSAVFPGAFVTYSNTSKQLNGVAAETIKQHGVYSEATAIAMAQAAAREYGADIAIGVTGTFANPDPANSDSVCGQVHYALYYDGKCSSGTILLKEEGCRAGYKMQTAYVIGERLLELIG